VLRGSVIALFGVVTLSCGNADPAPLPPGFVELEPVPKVDDCYISQYWTEVSEGHLPGARLIAHSPCRHTYGLTISDVPGITDVWFVKGLETVQEVTRIDENAELRSLEGLESVTTTDTLEITNNDSLKTLEGLDGLTSIAPPDDPLNTPVQTSGLLRIEFNPNLKSLDGLENLESANAIVISNCENLQSIEALYGLKRLNFLTIRNARVPRCQVDELLSRLENTDVEVDLAGLGSGDCP
jgi:hypothetical protein